MVLLTWVLGLPVLGQVPDWAAKAREAQRAGDFAGAAGAYRQLLASDPDNPRLLANLGVMLHLAGKNDEALGPLRRALARQPAMVTANLFIGLSLLNLGRARDALPYLERARKGEPAGPLPVLGLAKAYFALGDFRRANDLYEAAAEKDPRNSEIWAGLGATYIRLANANAARFWRANTDVAAINRALKAAGHPSARAEMLAAEHGLRIKPGDLEMSVKLTRACLALSVSALAKAVELAPQSYENRMLLADSLIASDRPADAAVEYGRAAQIRPQSAAAQVAMAAAFRTGGDDDAALPALKRALELDPGNAEANGLLGDLLAKRADFAGARPYLERALKARPDLAPARAAMARVYIAENRPEEAVAEIRKALPADWDGSYYYTLSQTLRKLGRTDEANAALDQFRARRALRRSRE